METIAKESVSSLVNNEIYHQYGERWYTAKDDPVALLRAESKTRNPWLINEIRRVFASQPVSILDIGCGAGFLTNELAKQGFNVTGIDASENSLNVAKAYDSTRSVTYDLGDATKLPYANNSFEAVSAMDLLEHVEAPDQVIREASRVLKPGGLFFFHTFNRNAIAWLIGIKGVEWFVKNTPGNMHILRLFIKPDELRTMCEQSHLTVREMRGLAPKMNRAFFKMLVTGEVEEGFKFQFVRAMLIGYSGVAIKGGTTNKSVLQMKVQ